MSLEEKNGQLTLLQVSAALKEPPILWAAA